MCGGSWCQGTIAAPTGDLKDFTNTTGFGAALFADISLGKGHVLRPRFDYVHYQEKSFDDSYTFGSLSYRDSFRYSVNSAGLGLDYLLYTAGKPEGFYLTLGLGSMRYEVKTEGTTTFTDPSGTSTQTANGKDKSDTKLAFTAGLGYDFNRTWGMNARYTSVHIEDTTFTAIHVGVTFKF